MHAGISPDLPAASLDDLNRDVKRDLTEWDAGVRWLEQEKLVLPFSTLADVVAAAAGVRTAASRLSNYRVVLYP